jgi:mersacidin/lichenicidin family type 2 lantibiotic
MKSHTILSHTDIIRAWKDETFRSSLTDTQRATLPEHPAGLVELSDVELDGVAGGAIKHNTTMFGATCDRWTVGCAPIIC